MRSGLEGILDDTELPDGWDLRRLKTLAAVSPSNVDKKNKEHERKVRLCNYKDVYYTNEIQDASGFMRATASSEEIERFRLRRGDVLVTKDSESWDDIAVPAFVATDFEDAVCGYHLYLVRPGPEINGRFLAYALRSRPVSHQFRIEAAGITRYGLCSDSFRSATIPTPPVVDQKAIANFLDHTTSRIEKLVDQMQRLTELLEVKRTTLIAQVVTKGLDRDIRMKESGVEWLGAIPEHWDVTRLRRVANVVDCKHRTPEYVPDGFPLVSTSEVKPGTLDLSVCTRFVGREDFEDMTEGGRQPQVGDIIYSRNASLGQAALVETEEAFCMGQDVVLIRTDGMLPKFLNLQLNSPLATRQVEAVGVGSTFSRINVSTIRDLLIIDAPREDQERIVRELNTRTVQMEQLQERAASAIDLLEEYRSALISAAVTGKIDVRDHPYAA